MIERCVPIGLRKQRFEEIADRDYADQGTDECFHRAETVAMQRQNGVRNNAGKDGAWKHRYVEKQVQSDDRTEKLCEIRRHGTELANDPHRKRH